MDTVLAQRVVAEEAEVPAVTHTIHTYTLWYAGMVLTCSAVSAPLQSLHQSLASPRS